MNPRAFLVVRVQNVDGTPPEQIVTGVVADALNAIANQLGGPVGLHMVDVAALPPIGGAPGGFLITVVGEAMAEPSQIVKGGWN